MGGKYGYSVVLGILVAFSPLPWIHTWASSLYVRLQFQLQIYNYLACVLSKEGELKHVLLCSTAIKQLRYTTSTLLVHYLLP